MYVNVPSVFAQALIYPLTVASKSTTTARHNAANKILKNMCEHSNTLVQQAMMVSEEPVRDLTVLGTQPEGSPEVVFLPQELAACPLWLPGRVPPASPRPAFLGFVYPCCFSPPLFDLGE